VVYIKYLNRFAIKGKYLLLFRAFYIIDLIKQVSQLLRAELKELVDIARATIEPIELCDEEW